MHPGGLHRDAEKAPASPLAGKHAVVIGRSNIVGKPAAILLLRENATVTVATPARRGSRSCAAARIFWWRRWAGRAFVTGDMVKPGATVIDVGINRSAEGQAVRRRGFCRRPAKKQRLSRPCPAAWA